MGGERFRWYSDCLGGMFVEMDRWLKGSDIWKKTINVRIIHSRLNLPAHLTNKLISLSFSPFSIQWTKEGLSTH